jgi:hypothetical protein
MKMIPTLSSGNANLKVDQEIPLSVNDAVDQKIRGLKIVINVKEERLTCAATFPETDSLEQDFANIVETLTDDEACVVLIRLKGSSDEEAASAPAAEELQWGLIQWSPKGAPVKQRMLCASSHKRLKDVLMPAVFKDYHSEIKEDMCLKKFIEATRAKTDEDRRAAMTMQEQLTEDVKAQVERERDAGPMRLAGMAALKIKAQDSFTEGMRQVQEENGKVLVAKLAGATGEELCGEVLDAESPEGLKGGRLPDNEPCYVVFRLGQIRIVIINWMPDNMPVKIKMKCSTFKSSVIELIKDANVEFTVNVASASDEDDLTEALLEPPAEKGEEEEVAPVQEKPKGFRPPPGAMAMPGMGGGFALPGMGSR